VDPHYFAILDPDPHPHQIKIQNRAVHGDQVVLELLPKSEWKAKGTALVQVTSLLNSVVDPHHFAKLDPHPHQIKIRIRIKIYNLDPGPDPDPRQFTDVKPKCMEYEPILALFKGLSLFLR
jgi:hypothetical protein